MTTAGVATGFVHERRPAKLAQPRPHQARKRVELRERLVRVKAAERGVERGQQIRRVRERHAVLERVVAEIDVARQPVRLGRDVVVVEHEGQARIGRERFAAGARRQVHASRDQAAPRRPRSRSRGTNPGGAAAQTSSAPPGRSACRSTFRWRPPTATSRPFVEPRRTPPPDPAACPTPLSSATCGRPMAPRVIDQPIAELPVAQHHARRPCAMTAAPPPHRWRACRTRAGSRRARLPVSRHSRDLVRPNAC